MTRAKRLGAITGACILLGGAAFAVTEHISYARGVYCALGTAATVGCDVAPSGAGRLVSALLILTALPMLGAIFALITSDRTHAAVAGRLRAEVDALEARLKAGADRHAQELATLARRHQAELLDRAEVQHLALKQHVTTTMKGAAGESHRDT